MVHLIFHLVVPVLIGFVFFRPAPWKPILIMVATMIVDVDHLLADPIFDPNRCSIGFHPLHTYPAIAIYVLMAFFKKTRFVGIGLVVHMFLDYLDCL